jgi:Beta propeller domain
MLLIDDRLVVFTSEWCSNDPPSYSGSAVSKFTILDTSLLSIIGDSKQLSGSYVNARAIGKHVYVVSSRLVDVYSYPSRLAPLTMQTEEMNLNGDRWTKQDYKAAAFKAAETYADEFVDHLIRDLQCDSVQQITLFQNMDGFLPYGRVVESIATVTGFDVKKPSTTTVSSRVMPTSNWNLYTSTSTLVLAAEGAWIGDDVQPETFILAYKLADAKATPIGVGKIPGYLLNQFSIDEHNGYLRFATSKRWRWMVEGDKWESEPISDSNNLIVVLKLPSSGGELDIEEVGRLEGLGKPGESIFSVRFMGDRAFVVGVLPSVALSKYLTICMLTGTI